MRILQVLPALESGGVERGTLEFARELVRLGHDSCVLSSGGRLVSRLEAEGSRHFQLPVHRKHLASLLQIRNIYRLLQELAPDIVHLRSRLPAWLTYLAWRSLRRPGPRLVTTVHGIYSVSPYSAIMTRGEAVITVSSAVRDYVRASYSSLAEERIRVVPRGVNTDEFHPDITARARPASLPKDCRLLLLPGRLTRWKGQALFLSLLRRLLDQAPELSIAGILVGGAEADKRAYEKELQGISRKLNLGSRVFFAGHQKDMAAWYRLADLVFNLSSRPEPFGRTITEALACGTPVVALDRGGAGEILRNCFPAGLVPVSDQTDMQLDLLAACCRRLLQQQTSIDSLPACYTLKAQTETTLNIYRSLLTHKPC